MPSPRRLTPNAIAKRLFGIAIDRDERASQLCIETLLTLAQNGYEAPQDGSLKSPKVQRFGVRSLATQQNFLEGLNDGLPGFGMTLDQYGAALRGGSDLRGSSNLGLVQQVLQGLVDPTTQKGQPGAWLLLPFHESLLWYDARRSGSQPWNVRKVYMRGSGITMARLLLDPDCDAETRDLASAAVEAIAKALAEETPLGRIAKHLEAPLAEPRVSIETQPDEREAWRDGGLPFMRPLAERLIRHAHGVMLQAGSSGPAKLWQLRTILALDLAFHSLTRAWAATNTKPRQRYLLLTFGGPPRSQNALRQKSEQSYLRCRNRFREATIATLTDAIEGLASSGPVDWADELESRRQRLDDIALKLSRAESATEFQALSREIFEIADYDRPGDGFRVLLESVGMLGGTGIYRYLTATPDLFSAMAGALSASMPMEAGDFFSKLFEEWGVIVNHARSTELATDLDGAELARNGRRAERVLVDAGVAVALSDRTTLVGERIAQRR